MEKKKRSKLEFVIALLFGFLCLIGIVFSLYKIIGWKMDTDKNKKIKEKIQESIHKTDDSSEFDVDWDTLNKQNSDTIGYLKVNSTNIDYVVVQGKDNNYYLKHNFNHEYNIAGWIFADYRNKLDGSDKNTIIYGHDTKDNSMFGSLKNILDKSWCDNSKNLDVSFVTENGVKKYHVFSVYIIDKEDYYITTDFVDNKEYIDFLNTITKRSIYDFNVELNENSQILTLSTCANGGRRRVVLHGVLAQ